jgi:hypothetical protein
MNKTIGLQLAVYSLLLAGLSYLTHYLVPSLARPTLIAGLAGGACCLVWSLRALAGRRGKALPILTLIPVNFILLSQTFFAWAGGSQEVAGRQAAAMVITLLFALSMAMLMRIAYAGVMFDGQPDSPMTEGGRDGQLTTGNNPARTEAKDPPPRSATRKGTPHV